MEDQIIGHKRVAERDLATRIYLHRERVGGKIWCTWAWVDIAHNKYLGRKRPWKKSGLHLKRKCSQEPLGSRKKPLSMKPLMKAQQNLVEAAAVRRKLIGIVTLRVLEAFSRSCSWESRHVQFRALAPPPTWSQTRPPHIRIHHTESSNDWWTTPNLDVVRLIITTEDAARSLYSVSSYVKTTAHKLAERTCLFHEKRPSLRSVRVRSHRHATPTSSNLRQ